LRQHPDFVGGWWNWHDHAVAAMRRAVGSFQQSLFPRRHEMRWGVLLLVLGGREHDLLPLPVRMMIEEEAPLRLQSLSL